MSRSTFDKFIRNKPQKTIWKRCSQTAVVPIGNMFPFFLRLLINYFLSSEELLLHLSVDVMPLSFPIIGFLFCRVVFKSKLPCGCKFRTLFLHFSLIGHRQKFVALLQKTNSINIPSKNKGDSVVQYTRVTDKLAHRSRRSSCNCSRRCGGRKKTT